MNTKILVLTTILLLLFPFFTVSCTPQGEEPPLPTPENVDQGVYQVKFNDPKQIILGLGVEIQSDRFGPNYVNSDPIAGAPYELTSSEQKRLATEVVSGFRYLRLAMGLWFRGTTEDRKHIIERYPGQLESIKNLISDAGIEGISLEYWSPAPYWKTTDDFRNGTLKSYDPAFLSQFGDALVEDINYLKTNGVHISTWGLQNEPSLTATNSLEIHEVGGYSHCYYTPDNYLRTFKSVAPKIRAALPNVEIIVDSWNGNVGSIATAIRRDPVALQYVDAWVYHRIGADASTLIEGQSRYLANSLDIPIYQNEYEYFTHQVEATTG
ncbi:MAG: hypothetical protein M0Q54_08890, partial [Pigmentiphaga sp.]|nr:hypothetical protein [Pigmentiphaga sp.]